MNLTVSTINARTMLRPSSLRLDHVFGIRLSACIPFRHAIYWIRRCITISPIRFKSLKLEVFIEPNSMILSSILSRPVTSADEQHWRNSLSQLPRKTMVPVLLSVQLNPVRLGWYSFEIFEIENEIIEIRCHECTKKRAIILIKLYGLHNTYIFVGASWLTVASKCFDCEPVVLLTLVDFISWKFEIFS